MTIPLDTLRRRSTQVSFTLLCLMLLVVSALAQSPRSTVRGTSDSGPQGKEITKLLGHLPLENMQVNEIFVQQRGDKYYLYLHRPGKNTFALVDVTQPDKPVLVNRNAPKGSVDGQIQPPEGGSVVALSVVPENPKNTAPVGPPPTETVQLLDMSNPKDIKVLKTVKGVAAMTPDDGRKLVYLVNVEGLWIISHHMTHPLPLCNSESALTPEPDCQ